MPQAPVKPVSAFAEGRLFSFTWPLIVITALMFSLCVASLSILSSVRAYVNGNGMWSKAELQAMAELRSYSNSGLEAEYDKFNGEIAVPLADRLARLQLQSDSPDYETASRELLGGRNDPADIPGMVRLFRLFQHSTLFADALAAWTQGDALILQLDQVGQGLHRAMLSGTGARERVAQQLQQAERIHLQVAPLEDQFSSALGRVSRQMLTLLLAFLTFCSAVLVLVGAAISRHTLRRSERIAGALHQTEERAYAEQARAHAALEAIAAQLRDQASRDALTGLANRREFERELALAIEDQALTGSDHALFYLDLDQLKVINDTCGHAAGDELIRQVSWSIKQGLRAGDLLARLGGDEYGVLLKSASPAVAVELAESIRRRIAELRFTWEDKLFVVNASIGVLSLADCLPSVADAMSAADQACYLAKDNGRNRVQYYRPDDQEMRARHGEMQWVERLNAALELDRFALFAQEIRELGSAANVAGASRAARFEVLLRLVEADGTLVEPMAFIPAAERYGLMPRIDRWVIAHACAQLAEMRSRLGSVPTCMINLSGSSLADPDLADFVRQQLDQCGLPHFSIGFELTETAAISNLGHASQMMGQLKDLGCLIALDDFGSGMSSFSYLRSLPLDFLKIDGEIVKDMASDPIDFAVVEAIQNIARVMGIKTVAESVENGAVLDAVLLVGVDFAQGFHLGRPVPLPEFLQRKSAGVAAGEPVDRALPPYVLSDASGTA